MTDREELRRLSEGITRLGPPPRMDVACRLAAAVPSLLDDLDAADQRIAELEAEARKEAASTHALGEEYEKQGMDLAFHRHGHNDALATIADLTLRLSIATETNVADRKRIAAGLREALQGWRTNHLCEVEYSDEELARIDRIEKLLPSEET